MTKPIDPEEFKLGVHIIDDEHRVLIDYLNMLKGPQSQNNKEFETELMLGLLKYVEIHFTVEEEIIRAYGYPHIEAHKKSHKGFEDKLKELKINIENGEFDVRDSTKIYLEQWLLNHISKEDRHLCEFLNSKGLH